MASLGEILRVKSTSFSPAKTQPRPTHQPRLRITNPFRKLQGIVAAAESILTSCEKVDPLLPSSLLSWNIAAVIIILYQGSYTTFSMSM